MVLGRSCNVDMSHILEKALRKREQEEMERVMKKELFDMSTMQSRTVRGYVRKYKAQEKRARKEE